MDEVEEVKHKHTNASLIAVSMPGPLQNEHPMDYQQQQRIKTQKIQQGDRNENVNEKIDYGGTSVPTTLWPLLDSVLFKTNARGNNIKLSPDQQQQQHKIPQNSDQKSLIKIRDDGRDRKTSQRTKKSPPSRHVKKEKDNITVSLDHNLHHHHNPTHFSDTATRHTMMIQNGGNTSIVLENNSICVDNFNHDEEDVIANDDTTDIHTIRHFDTNVRYNNDPTHVDSMDHYGLRGDNEGDDDDDGIEMQENPIDILDHPYQWWQSQWSLIRAWLEKWYTMTPALQFEKLLSDIHFFSWYDKSSIVKLKYILFRETSHHHHDDGGEEDEIRIDPTISVNTLDSLHVSPATDDRYPNTTRNDSVVEKSNRDNATRRFNATIHSIESEYKRRSFIYAKRLASTLLSVTPIPSDWMDHYRDIQSEYDKTRDKLVEFLLLLRQKSKQYRDTEPEYQEWVDQLKQCAEKQFKFHQHATQNQLRDCEHVFKLSLDALFSILSSVSISTHNTRQDICSIVQCFRDYRKKLDQRHKPELNTLEGERRQFITEWQTLKQRYEGYFHYHIPEQYYWHTVQNTLHWMKRGKSRNDVYGRWTSPEAHDMTREDHDDPFEWEQMRAIKVQIEMMRDHFQHRVLQHQHQHHQNHPNTHRHKQRDDTFDKFQAYYTPPSNRMDTFFQYNNTTTNATLFENGYDREDDNNINKRNRPLHNNKSDSDDDDGDEKDTQNLKSLLKRTEQKIQHVRQTIQRMCRDDDSIYRDHHDQQEFDIHTLTINKASPTKNSMGSIHFPNDLQHQKQQQQQQQRKRRQQYTQDYLQIQQYRERLHDLEKYREKLVRAIEIKSDNLENLYALDNTIEQFGLFIQEMQQRAKKLMRSYARVQRCYYREEKILEQQTRDMLYQSKVSFDVTLEQTVETLIHKYESKVKYIEEQRRVSDRSAYKESRILRKKLKQLEYECTRGTLIAHHPEWIQYHSFLQHMYAMQNELECWGIFFDARSSLEHGWSLLKSVSL